MGLYEQDFMNQQQLEARYAPRKLFPRRPHPWKKGGPFDRESEEIENWGGYKVGEEVPCKMQQAYEDWLANGGVGTFSIMLVCTCPRCTIRCGTL